MRSRASFRFRRFRLSVTVVVEAEVPEPGSERVAPAGRTLAEDLAQFTGPAELLDLQAALDRYGDDETAEVRAVLAGQALGRQASALMTGPLGRVPAR